MLFNNRADDAGANGTAAFTDGETQTFVHGDRGDQFDGHGYVVARHNHFDTGRKFCYTGYVGCTEVELRTIAVEERGVTTTLFFGQYVGFGLELGVRGDAARLGKYLTALNVFTLDATQQGTDVVAGTTFVEQLAEHFYAGYGGLGGGFHTDDSQPLHQP